MEIEKKAKSKKSKTQQPPSKTKKSFGITKKMPSTIYILGGALGIILIAKVINQYKKVEPTVNPSQVISPPVHDEAPPPMPIVETIPMDSLLRSIN